MKNEFKLGTRIYEFSKPTIRDKDILQFLKMYYEKEEDPILFLNFGYIWWALRKNKRNESISFTDFCELDFTDGQLNLITNFLFGTSFSSQKNNKE